MTGASYTTWFADAFKKVSKVIKVLFVAVSVCNTGVLLPYFENAVENATNFISRCSYNQLHIDASIIPFTVQIPCGMSTNCDTETWAQLTDTSIQRYSQANPNNFNHIVYIVPYGLCPFVGLGDIGPCNGYCRIWVTADKYNVSSVYLHELGHNLGLYHSGYNGQEYGDLSSAMGGCCDQRCFSAVEEYVLNWTKPKVDIQNPKLKLKHTVVLASRPIPENNQIELAPNEYIKYNDYFIQYRKNKWDLEFINDQFRDSVNVYMYSRTQTTLLAVIKDLVSVQVGDIQITVFQLSPDKAVVQWFG
ncbi:hypothetical protein EB118_12515 [bacterium]|nr:hypothetical protein [bacterium]